MQPVNALKGLVVKQVACGDYHTLCLLGIRLYLISINIIHLDTGVLYAWGGTLHKVKIKTKKANLK